MISFLLNIFLMVFACVLAVQATTVRSRISLPLAVCLGGGLGIGIVSAGYFVLLNVVGNNAASLWWVVEIVLAGLVALTASWRLRRKQTVDLHDSQPAPTFPSARTTHWLKLAFVGLLVITTCSFIAQCWLHPHSDWDALSIWNVRSRFLTRAADNLHTVFSPLIFWSHLDYPLLLPAVVGLGLSLTQESQLAPILVAFAFTLLTAGLLATSLSALKSRMHGFLAGVALLATPFWIQCGAMMYADVPLAYYFLGTIVCCALYDKEKCPAYLVLAGIFASMAAWTKNEGLLIIPCLLLANVLAHGRIALRKQPLLALTAGALPITVLLVWFKLTLAPANDLVLGQGRYATAERLLNPSRWLTVGAFFLVDSVTFGNWLVSPIPLFLPLWFMSRSKLDNVGCKRAFLTAALMLAGYAFVFLVTPSDLPQHLTTAANRLFLQVWPLFVFALVGCISLEAFALPGQQPKLANEHHI